MITDLHDLIDDIPISYCGIELKGRKLCPMDGKELERIIQQMDLKPANTKIERGSPQTAHWYDIPFLYRMVTWEWRVKRAMKERNFDFAVIQIGYYNICYDFYKKDVLKHHG